MKIRGLIVFFTISAGLLVSLGSHAEEVADPWEDFNRSMFAFNDAADTYFFKPVAQGYQAITPDPVEHSVSNFFSNLTEVRNIVNDVLQGKLGQAGNDAGRLVVNTTLGVAGLFDVAKNMGFEKSEGEDFGQTLAAWGVPQGPYVVWPILGSSTLRDTGGTPANTALDPIFWEDHIPTRNTVFGVSLIDARAGFLDTEELISGDKYTFIRDAYLQRRDYLIQDGEVEDTFGEDSEDDDF